MPHAVNPQLPQPLTLRKLYVGRRVHESPPTRVEIWYGGKPACQGVDDGSGGGMTFRTLDRAVEAQLRADIAALPPEMPGADWDADAWSLWREGRQWDLEQVVWAEIQRVLQARQAARWCRKDTLYRLTGDPPDTWRVRKNVPFAPQVAAQLRQEHGARLEAILNETIPQTRGSYPKGREP